MAVLNIVKTIASTLNQQMEKDPSVLVLGQDVGKRGGVFLATEGLFDILTAHILPSK